MRLTIISLYILLAISMVWAGANIAKRWKHHRLTNPAEALATHGELKDGDLIFQQSRSRQSRAIAQATHSGYTHCGLLEYRKKHWYVLEAVQPVKRTPLADWIARGESGLYAIRRIRHWPNGQSAAGVMSVARSLLGKPYDQAFAWDDRAIYCSELIYKAYERGAGIHLGRLKRLKDFDLTDPAVQVKLHERYGQKTPLLEPVISPEALFTSKLLIEVR